MSTKDPVLAVKKYTENGKTMRLVVVGGLHYLRGNSSPHFSLTATLYEDQRDVAGGCMHDEIERQFPGRFTDFIAMHLSDIDGTPMHFEVNGWYDLAGALGGAGEQYHVGNSKRNFPCVAPEGKPWANTEHREPTVAECLQIFADHCRIPLAEAQCIVDDVRSEFGPENESEMAISPWSRADYARGRAKWGAFAATMTERFQTEAKACIAKHSLAVYGDAWVPKVAA